MRGLVWQSNLKPRILVCWKPHVRSLYWEHKMLELISHRNTETVIRKLLDAENGLIQGFKAPSIIVLERFCTFSWFFLPRDPPASHGKYQGKSPLYFGEKGGKVTQNIPWVKSNHSEIRSKHLVLHIKVPPLKETTSLESCLA